MGSLLLTEDELEALTKYKTYSGQIRELRRLGIEHRERRDGFPLVSRRAFERAMGGESANDSGEWTPDFSGL